METTGAKIRAALRQCGRPYSAALRRRAVGYAAAEAERGVSSERIAAELGISAVTLRAWIRADVLRPVEIVGDAARTTLEGDAENRSLTAFDTRSGIRVDGLDLESAIRLVERLR
jgi:predicted transcriptional regulator